jgi:hypothetical protein
MQSLERRGLAHITYLWQDDNLSCGYTWSVLTNAEREYVKSYRNYGRCCCLKSFTSRGFCETTGVAPRFFDGQIKLLDRLVRWGIDVYAYVTLTVASLDNLKEDMRLFVDRLQVEVHHNMPLRVVPLEISRFNAMVQRITPERERALKNQYHALDAWLEEIHRRFSSQDLNRPIYEVDIK